MYNYYTIDEYSLIYWKLKIKVFNITSQTRTKSVQIIWFSEEKMIESIISSPKFEFLSVHFILYLSIDRYTILFSMYQYLLVIPKTLLSKMRLQW